MKNCLSVILAITWLIERETSDKICERVQRLRASAEQLRTLVMTGALAEETPRRVVGITFSPHLMLKAVVSRAHDHAVRAGVRLEHAGEMGTFIGDEEALREALYNLVTNAIDATPAGGTVLVSTRETDGGDQLWEVRDTGCGIPPEQMTTLGRAFRTSKAGGSGIGLAVVQAAATAHEGVLRVESRQDHGSTFTLLLPRR